MEKEGPEDGTTEDGTLEDRGQKTDGGGRRALGN